ncbi:si:dkey-261l7.2 [Plectropomus leopardus]|uniref:si:dkey-261l7.2 n=1 Tax=Plectropomus leopardus TaxID=160734 RepID=UPI001C4BF52C|nr:si:dkey-261l7.2 [Plectropomus leopardus]
MIFRAILTENLNTQVVPAAWDGSLLYVNKTEVKPCHSDPVPGRKQARCLADSWRKVWILNSRCAVMPQLSATAVLQLVLLLSAVPAQYFISRWSGSTPAQRFHASTRLLRIWRDWRASYLSSTVWRDWANQQMSKVMSLLGLEEKVPLDSPAIEEMIYDNDQDFFGASKTVRSPRPPYVFLRVGEVVMERKGHMVGVVVSWDPEMRAPPQWVDKVYSSAEGLKAEKTPHYKVLFSGPGPSSIMVGYLPQTQLERITGMRPDIPTLEKYFTHFDGERFIMQPWLKELYPEDGKEED